MNEFRLSENLAYFFAVTRNHYHSILEFHKVFVEVQPPTQKIEPDILYKSLYTPVALRGDKRRKA